MKTCRTLSILDVGVPGLGHGIGSLHCRTWAADVAFEFRRPKKAEESCGRNALSRGEKFFGSRCITKVAG